MSHDKRLLASCSLDDIVKIIEVDHLAERPKDGRAFDMDEYELQLQRNKLRADDEDMEESKENEDWSDDSDESSEIEDNGKHKKKDTVLNPKGNSIGKSRKM